MERGETNSIYVVRWYGLLTYVVSGNETERKRRYGCLQFWQSFTVETDSYRQALISQATSNKAKKNSTSKPKTMQTKASGTELLTNAALVSIERASGTVAD